MKRIIKLTIISFIIILGSISNAYAFTVTGYGSSSFSLENNNNNSNNNPFHGSRGADGVVPTSATTKNKVNFVGVLVSLIDYQNTDGPDEKVLAKRFYVSGPIGSYTSSFETENYFGYGNNSDYYYDGDGRLKTCGTKDYYNSYIHHEFFQIKYAEPTRSASLKSQPGLPVQEKTGYDFSSADLDQTVEGLLIPEIVDEYNTYKTVLGYYIEEEIFDKYFLKYEPVYRTYPALMEEHQDYQDEIDDIFHISENMLKYVDFDTTHPSDLGVDVSDKSFKTLDCEHEAKEAKWHKLERDVTDSWPDEESCKGKTIKWKDGKCILTSDVRYPDDDPDPTHFDYYPCFMKSTYMYHVVKMNGVKNTMSTVREGYTGSSLTGALYSGYSKNKHDVVNDYGLAMEGNDYFIGTTYNNSIAVSNNGVHKFDPTKHKYYLVESGTEKYESNKVLGMSLYNLSEIIDIIIDNCQDVCAEFLSDKSSESYLRCSQSYCDSHITYSPSVYATDSKRSCLLDKDKCDYHPKTPIDCDNPVVNSIKNAASSEGVDGRNISNSSCGFTGDTYTDDNKTVNNQKGSYYYCQRMGSGIKITDENGKTYYKYGVSNTVDSYINIECKESAGFDFADLSNEHLYPGMGFEYSTYLDGSKTCRLFFDTVSWEFDFASTHSRDSIRKKLLLQKVNAFNMLEANKSGSIKVNGSELLGKAIDQEGTEEKMSLDDVEDDLIYLSALNYNTSDAKASSKSKVTEYIDEKADISGNDVYEEGERFNLEIKDRFASTSYNSDTQKDGLNLYHEYNFDESRQLNEEGTRDINSYNLTSTAGINYYLPELCVASDNRRTLKRASEGSCDVLGTFYNQSVPLREYYTSLKATPHSSLNNMNNTVSVKKSYFNDIVHDSEEYLKGEDTCPYVIVKDVPNPSKARVSCEIVLEKSATCYESNDVYISSDSSVTARLIVNNKSNDVIDIDNQKIELVGTSTAGEKNINFQVDDLKTKTTSSGEITSNNVVNISGTINVHSNDEKVILPSNTVKCSKKINLIKQASSCTITKDGTSYWITPNGEGDVYATTNNKRNEKGELVFSKLTHNEDGKYLYQVISDNKNETIIAKVMSGSSTNYCTYIPTNCPELSACKELFTQDQSKKIRDYCSTNYKIDKYHYDSPEACINDCSTSCIDCDKTKKYCILELTAKERENFDIVHTFCNSTDSAQEYYDCMDDCLNINPPGSSPESLYRPINLNNPFPSSKFSAESGYQTGKRAIGQEWLIHYNKIMEDKEQVMNGIEPEYVIDLDIAKINAIRYDTNTRNEGLMSGSIYSDTTNLPKIASCTSTGYQGYCSSFIHEDFTDYFKIVMGHKN